MSTVTVTAAIVKPHVAALFNWLEARGFVVDNATGKATKPAPATDGIADYYQAKAARKARMKARQVEATKAMRLYSIDNVAARRGEREYPKLENYTAWTWVDGPRELVATEYAKSRFAELSAKK